MVECESFKVERALDRIKRFNRYMVECEFDTSIQLFLSVMCFNRYMVECEYIAGLCFLKSVSRFNRYMVECEFCFTDSPSDPRSVLIDTWWNVNDIIFFITHLVFRVLIDTWWNVNTGTTTEQVQQSMF